jgi:hypothetical protein
VKKEKQAKALAEKKAKEAERKRKIAEKKAKKYSYLAHSVMVRLCLLLV